MDILKNVRKQTVDSSYWLSYDFFPTYFGWQYSSKYLLLYSTEETHTSLWVNDDRTSIWVNYALKLLKNVISVATFS